MRPIGLVLASSSSPAAGLEPAHDDASTPAPDVPTAARLRDEQGLRTDAHCCGRPSTFDPATAIDCCCDGGSTLICAG